MRSDPYEILGISRRATALQARAAYRRLALMHHPDRNPGDARAAERFKRIVRAYRRIATGVASRREPVVRAGPRPDRYVCTRCGDSFPFAESCSRCGVALHDRDAGPAPSRAAPEVEAMIEQLMARRPPREIELPLPVPALLVLGCLFAAFFIWQVGPLGPALLFLGFAAYVAGVEGQRRLSRLPSLG